PPLQTRLSSSLRLIILRLQGPEPLNTVNDAKYPQGKCYERRNSRIPNALALRRASLTICICPAPEAPQRLVIAISWREIPLLPMIWPGHPERAAGEIIPALSPRV